MTNLNRLSRRDIERLSAYLDGMLSSKEAARLEANLKDDSILAAALEEMREAVWLLRSMPEVKLARDFRLTPEKVGIRERPRAYPFLQLATAAATLAFVLVVGVDVLAPTVMRSPSMPASKEQVVLEELPVEEEVAVAVEAPAMAFAEEAEGIGMASEPDVEVEGETIVGEEARALDSAAPTSAPEDLAMTPPAPAEAPPPAPTGTEVWLDESAEPIPEEAKAGGAVPEPSPTAVEPVANYYEVLPTPAPVEHAPSAIPPLRIVEIGLGVLAALLAGLTFWYRKRA